MLLWHELAGDVSATEWRDKMVKLSKLASKLVCPNLNRRRIFPSHFRIHNDIGMEGEWV